MFGRMLAAGGATRDGGDLCMSPFRHQAAIGTAPFASVLFRARHPSLGCSFQYFESFFAKVFVLPPCMMAVAVMKRGKHEHL